MKCKNLLFAFMFMLMLTCNLNAQEASSENTGLSETAITEQATAADVAEAAADAVAEATETGSAEATAADVAQDVLDVAVDDADDEGDAAANEEADDSDTIDEIDELASDDDEEALDDDGESLVDDDEEEDEFDEVVDHVTIRLNEDGELVGQAKVSVNGNWLPVEASVVLVSNGVMLNKMFSDEDGSFSFQNIAPGDYNLYGTASSFCGQQALTVVSETNCCDNVRLRMTQDSGGTCYSGVSEAPAATFAGGSDFGGGFVSGPIVSGGGGGFAGGGGIAAGGGGGGFGLRALAVGGIATAIAVGVSDGDDEVSPSN